MEENIFAYKPLVIGCIAPTEAQRNCFRDSFIENNKENIGQISRDIVILKDETVMRFMSSSILEKFRGLIFDQLLFYNMTEKDFKNSDLLLRYSKLPIEFNQYKIQYYEDN